MGEEQDKDAWFIPASEESKKTSNTIKEVVDGRKLDKNPNKEVLNLSIGTSHKEYSHIYGLHCMAVLQATQPSMVLRCMRR